MHNIKVYITTRDPILYDIYNKEKCEEYFGKDFLNEYGVEIPYNLLLDFEKAEILFMSVQDRILRFIKEKK